MVWAQSAEDVRLTVGKSIVIDYPEDVRQISTSDPAIIDASPVTTREILIHAKGVGSATLVVWSINNQRMFYNITVGLDVEPLRRILRETFPNEPIAVNTSDESVSLNGTVSAQPVADRAAALASVFARTVVNNLQITAQPVQQQILLRVRFAELDRVRAQEYGVNIFSLGALNTIGSIGTGQFTSGTVTQSGATATPTLTVSDALNIFAFRPDLDLAAMIRALQTENILQVLAEPNLIASNGQEASFLVGGEFPVPVLQGGANSGAVTIQYREFGVRLRFLPQVTTNDTIKLNLTQEVSTLDNANGVSIGGFFIPALSSRRAETSIELGEGQTFVVAGLMNNNEREIFSRIPVISSIPILGTLFKSRSERKDQTELVMLVTPEITMPLNPNDPKPDVLMPNEFLRRLTPEEIQQRRGAATAGERVTASRK